MPPIDEAKARVLKDEVREGWTEESVGWVKHAALIDEWSKEATRAVVAASGARPGAAALDVACGPGETALAIADAVAPGGTVMAVDLVPEMVRGAEDVARRRGTQNASFREGDAEALPFADASFDLVTCRHGVMFFPQAETALREFRRVLRPGGRATLMAWGPLDRNPFFLTISGPFMRRMPEGPPPPEDAPGPFRFARNGKLSEVMRAAGLQDVREESVVVAWDFPGSPEQLWSAAQEISSSLFGWFRAELSPADFDAAAAEALAGARARAEGGEVRFTATMVLATGIA